MNHLPLVVQYTGTAWGEMVTVLTVSAVTGGRWTALERGLRYG
ncbi:MAG: hypothetical protein ABSF70_00870 [Terracidiphilus sp.]